MVERDGVAFDPSAFPDGVVDRLAEQRVVLLGETHHLREHWAFVATLMAELHADGFHQLLIEAPHMAGWLIDDYVQGGPLAPEWDPPPFYERRLSAIRAFNENLEPGERVHVRGIDANEEWYGGAGDFRLLVGWLVDSLPSPGAVELLLEADYQAASEADQADAIGALLGSLVADRSVLTQSWGAPQYDLVVEMVEVELASIDVRAKDGDDGSRAREDVIKDLAEQTIGQCACGTVIDIGGHHAQKSHLMGTEQATTSLTQARWSTDPSSSSTSCRPRPRWSPVPEELHGTS
ncbi:MAG: hypothetical protein OER95_02155 [Acidimicrobiia bacterium]|nr:hypothetical protein [Acidimicrobiia bacterium]